MTEKKVIITGLSEKGATTIASLLAHHKKDVEIGFDHVTAAKTGKDEYYIETKADINFDICEMGEVVVSVNMEEK